MTPALFKKRLCGLGFQLSKRPGGGHFIRVINGIEQHVARDSVRGGAWRLFLAVGEVSEIWPMVDVSPASRVDWEQAESPWFKYFTDLDPTDELDAQLDNKEIALEKCLE